MEAEQSYVTGIARLFPPQGQWTERDYFALPESNQIVELANGELIMTPSPTTAHQIAVLNLAAALKLHVVARKLGIVFAAPYDVRLAPGLIRQPDVLFVSEQHRQRITEKCLDGPPDWIAEIVSEGTRETDEGVKLAEYARAGVPEYWLADTEARTIRVYLLTGGAYRPVATYSLGQIACLETIEGFSVAVDTLFSG